MQCLLIAPPDRVEPMLASLRSIDPALEATAYTGGSLRRRTYDFLIVAAHVGMHGVSLAGDGHLAPVILGGIAEQAKVKAIFMASCDGPGIALELAGQAKSATVLYYPAALDPETGERLALTFAENYFCDGAACASEAASAAGYEVLNPIWIMPDNTGSFGSNPEMMRLLLDLQRGVSETQAEMRHVREDVASLKGEVKRIGDTQTMQTAQATQVTRAAPLTMTPAAVIAALILIAAFAVAIAVILARLAGV